MFQIQYTCAHNDSPLVTDWAAHKHIQTIARFKMLHLANEKKIQVLICNVAVGAML